jgi:hypothetical protein
MRSRSVWSNRETGHTGELGDDLCDVLGGDRWLAALAALATLALSELFVGRAADARSRQIDDANGLVGQGAAGHVAARPGDGEGESLVVVADAVMQREPLGHTGQDQISLFPRRFVDLHGREAASEAGIGLDHATQLLRGHGADERELAAGEGDLELRCGFVEGPAREQLGELIHEQHDVALGAADLRANRGDLLCEGAPGPGPRHEIRDGDLHEHTRSDDARLAEARREALGHTRLADPRRAHETHAVLASFRE